jgi:hypothetical protein
LEKYPTIYDSDAKFYYEPCYSTFRRERRIEIKPSVGDDYPAILRQMRANESNVLFLETYTGIGATEQQFIQTFDLSNINVVFRRDVDAAKAESLTGAITLRN